MKFRLIILFLVFGVFLAAPSLAAEPQAECEINNPSATLCNPLRRPGGALVENIIELAKYIILIVGGFSTLIPIVAVTFAGFSMVVAQGEAEAITRAKTALKWAVYGFIMAILSFVLLSAMINLLGAGKLEGIEPLDPGSQLQNPLLTERDGVPAPQELFSQFVYDMLERFLQVVGIIAILMLIFNGLRYITAGGDDEQITQAKNAMKWIAAGILVILLSYVIIKAAAKLVGLE